VEDIIELKVIVTLVLLIKVYNSKL